MFCGKCGARLPEDAVACDKCGAPVRIRPEAAEYMEIKKNAPEKSSEGGQSESRRQVKNKGRKNGNSSAARRKKSRRSEGNKSSRSQETREAENHSRREAPAAEEVSEPVRRKTHADEEEQGEIRQKRRNSAQDGVEIRRKRRTPDEKGGASRKKRQGAAGADEQPRRKTVPAAEESACMKTALKTVQTAAAERPAYEDMDAYLASLPMQEQLRRRIAQIRHRREEAAEARRMQTHLDRAARYYETEPDSDDDTAVMPFSALSRALSRIPTEAQSTAQEEDRNADPSLIEKEISREREAKTRARIEKSEHRGTTSAEQRKVNETSVHPAVEDECPQEHLKKQDQSLTEPVHAPKAAGPEQIPQKAEPEQIQQEIFAEGPELSETVAEKERPGMPVPEPVQNLQTAVAAGAKEEPALLEEMAESSKPSVLEPEPSQTTTTAESVANAAVESSKPSVPEPEPALTVTETEPETAEEPADSAPAAAATDAAASKEQSEWIEQETRRRVQEALAEQAERTRRQSREQRIEDARLLKRYREDMPDQIDETLGRYGLSKDAAVRLGTLLLIVVLSVIYVAGRGRQPAVDTTVPRAGEGATGTPAFQQTEEEETEDADEIPAAGDDLDSAGSGGEAEQ